MKESYHLLTGMWQHYLHIVGFWYDTAYQVLEGVILIFEVAVHQNIWNMIIIVYQALEIREDIYDNNRSSIIRDSRECDNDCSSSFKGSRSKRNLSKEYDDGIVIIFFSESFFF
jgi:hypothetical protein